MTDFVEAIDNSDGVKGIMIEKAADTIKLMSRQK
jgi:hypothetical protein